MLVIRGRLTPEVGAVVQRALEAAADRLRQESVATPAAATLTEEVTCAQRRADALALLAESALAADLDRGSPADRYQVVLHVDPAAVRSASEPNGDRGQAALEDGPRVSAETSQRLACDAAVVVLTHGADGSVLDVGRKTRTVPTALRRALTARDVRCRFPGCHARHCDAHHVRHWADGGATRLDNLVLLCRRHHRFVHEQGWTVTMRADGVADFVRPDGSRLDAVPPPLTGWTDDTPLAPVDARLAAAGLTIGSYTATPVWHGDRLDVGWAVDVLRDRQFREASH